MKRLVIASLFATTLLGAQAQSFTDTARVRSAEPQYETVDVPRNECTSQWINEDRRGAYQPQNRQQDRQYGGAIVGGLAGGVLGHQIGGGSGKDAATALGVVLGAITGDRLENRNQAPQYSQNSQYPQYGQYQDGQREVQRCRTVNDRQSRITGYRVTYEYRGQHYTTMMRGNPGNSLPVRVSVQPMERY
ncbi:MAG: glycine zipper 2TM domain-containing protein [Gammaproteobacteria bacterium]|uniref:glycine zipper 2TM domain-containing protein n=1 Tax=Rhodoferax sp. TaxID=50421 RepID=UPI0017F0143B|nr:glycine zipper 2TM domain-containing protein [Rhodoferax sp.]MBU3900255.1 glycine zipper 2TM domain-containing protein [Gammaproteobacteria bacterium]MBA3057912.1 glycine zipper 2TM domain-containing protein [Rhodoferax sp.]MBU3997959.1 glycine zipper 2TM domain-containing protein [Gammaproteobacteria bacterium]MBU4079407.1 glycine zipper 2TM domain-containing protein [Gammaproteobacteria bacterium]MBU4111689.1 glycine zipper 2TM domain-containing protein [Gammaproteobacteria bacterium]